MCSGLIDITGSRYYNRALLTDFSSPPLPTSCIKDLQCTGFYTSGGQRCRRKISQHGPIVIPLEIELSSKNNFVCTFPQLLGRKRRKLQLKKRDCHALEKLKIEMGMVGSIFELRSPNFVKMQVFWRHSNDIKMNF